MERIKVLEIGLFSISWAPWLCTTSCETDNFRAGLCSYNTTSPHIVECYGFFLLPTPPQKQKGRHLPAIYMQLVWAVTIQEDSHTKVGGEKGKMNMTTVSVFHFIYLSTEFSWMRSFCAPYLLIPWIHSPCNALRNSNDIAEVDT